MAYYDDNEDENNQVQPGAPGQGVVAGQGQSVTSAPGQGQQEDTAGQPTQGGGSAVLSGQGGPSPAGSGPAGAGAAASKGGGTPFVGISEYLNANKPQSTKLAKDVGGYVTGLGDQAKNTLKSGQDQYSQAVQANTVNTNQNLLNEINADPTKVAQDAAKKAEFQKGLKAQYQGPQNLESTNYFKGIQDAVNKAKTVSSQTESEAGQKELLSNLQKQERGNVHKGAATFDSLLLQAAPEAREILASSRQNLSGLDQSVASAQEQARQLAAQAAAQTAATRNAYSGVGGINKGLEQTLAQRAKTMQDQYESERGGLSSALRSGAGLTEFQLGNLGLDQGKYSQLLDTARQAGQAKGGAANTSGMGLDLSQFIKGSSNINAQNVATQEEMARYAALQDLMGDPNSFFSSAVAPNSAGYNVGFDYEGAMNALKGMLPAAQSTPIAAFQPKGVGSGGSAPTGAQDVGWDPSSPEKVVEGLLAPTIGPAAPNAAKAIRKGKL